MKKQIEAWAVMRQSEKLGYFSASNFMTGNYAIFDTEEHATAAVAYNKALKRHDPAIYIVPVSVSLPKKRSTPKKVK